MTLAVDVLSEETGSANKPPRRSPLHATHTALGATFYEGAGWQMPSAYKSTEEEVAAVQQRVGICDISAAGVLRVRGGQVYDVLVTLFDEAPAAVGDVVVIHSDDGRARMAGLTRDECLILTRPSTHAEIHTVEQEIARTANDDQFVSVVDQTSALAGLLIAGPAGRALLSKLCALSFHPDTFPDLHVAQSSLATVHATIIRNDLGDVPAFEIYVDRSYAVYVWESVVDAGHEFGIAPVGWTAIKSLVDSNIHADEGA